MSSRIYFDTEFIEDGKTIELVSIGMVRADGETYYAEVEGVDYSRADPWLHKNVFPHLQGGEAVKPKAQIADEIRAFSGENPEFWAYYADYDWVALCQLYGRMIDLPKGWPKFCRDLKQAANGAKLPAQTSTEHHALADALWVREAAAALEGDAQPVAVKALEWHYERVNGSDIWRGHGILGRYTVVGGSWWGPEPTNDYHNSDTDDEAKAAAQADYEQRIRSALVATPPTPKLGVAVEALRPFVAAFDKRRIAYSKRYQDQALGFANFDKMPDDWPMGPIDFNMGTFRRAREALSQLEKPGE